MIDNSTCSGMTEPVRCPCKQADAYDLSDPVDILLQLRGWDEEVAATAKWSLRRDLLAKLRTLAEAPRLEPSDFGDVLRRLKIVITKDSNVVCVAEVCNMMYALSISPVLPRTVVQVAGISTTMHMPSTATLGSCSFAFGSRRDEWGCLRLLDVFVAPVTAREAEAAVASC